MSAKLSILDRHADTMKAVYDRLERVHKRPLHPGQIQIAKDYFIHGKRIIQSQWGRNGGKTEGLLFIATVACLLNDNFICYIITPERKQGKEIYWASKRLQNYPPPQYVDCSRDTEIRLVFKNGSFICVDGCENYNAHRGLKPNLVLYDEFQNHNKEFHLEVMAPNLLGKDAALLIFGTPPKQRSAYYVEFRETLLKQMKLGDDSRGYYEFPTEINPAVDKAELQKVRKELIESGNEVIWQREYEGKLAFGGEDIVFPKWDPQVHCRSHKVVMSYLGNDAPKLKWYTICDPGTSTCFAVLFVAYNPYTQQIFILDEIYEKDRKRTDTKQIFDRIRKKESELYPLGQQTDWTRIYDEAAAWFQREVVANYKHQYSKINMMPSKKNFSDEETDISRIKMLMYQPNALLVSDRCYWLRWEIESFITDEDGQYSDRNNHLIDCLKYLMQATNWKLIEKADQEVVITPDARIHTIPAYTVEVEGWADLVTENSLNITENDILSEYFD